MKKILVALVLFSAFPLSTFASTCVSIPSGSVDGASEAMGYPSFDSAAQPFSVSSSCSVGIVSATVKSVGSPSTPLEYDIYSGASTPTTLLGTSSPSAVPSAYGLVDANFAGSVSLSSGVQYWLVLTTSGSDASNYYAVQLQNPAIVFGNNKYRYSGSWLNEVGYSFQEFYINAAAGMGSGASSTIASATSTIEQTQSNLFNAFFIFFASFYGMVWLMRKH